jgi:hypothetical protein
MTTTVGVMNGPAKPSMVRDARVEIEKINNPALSVMEQTGKSYRILFLAFHYRNLSLKFL